MTRLIDADELFVKWQITMTKMDEPVSVMFILAAMTDLQQAPTVDAEPVRHGKWKPARVVDDCFWICSSCGFPSEASAANILYKYCPVCGAKMKEKKEW